MGLLNVQNLTSFYKFAAKMALTQDSAKMRKHSQIVLRHLLADGFFVKHSQNFGPEQLDTFKKAVEASRDHQGGELFAALPELDQLSSDLHNPAKNRNNHIGEKKQLYSFITGPEADCEEEIAALTQCI